MIDNDGPAETAEPEGRDPIAQLSGRLASLSENVGQLSAQLRREHDRAAAREGIIDHLHGENERLRAGERHLILRPVLTDLQRLRHELLRESTRLPEHMTAEQAGAMLHSVAHTLQMCLERCGVELISAEAGTPVDPARHRVVRTEPTSDAALDATVAAVQLDGYLDTVSGRVLTAAEVRARRWTAPADPEETDDAA